MSATTRSLMRRPRPVEASWPTGLTLLAAALYVVGWVANPASSIWINAAAATVLVGVCVFLGVRAWRTGQVDRAASFQIERAALVVTTAFVVVRTLSALGVEIYPLIYLLLAFFVAFEGRTAALAAVAAALLLEWGSHWLGTPAGAAHISTALALEPTVDWTVLLTRTAFIGLFGFLSYFVHGTEVLERRRRHRQEVDEQREQMLRQAREFRLLNSGRLESAAADRSQAEQMATCDAVEAVQHTTYVSLSLLKTALDCHTCVLLWFDVRGEKLHIKELVSESDAVIEGGIKPEKGVIGGISRRRQPVKLDDLRSGFRGLSYYRSPQPVRHFVGVPVIEDGHLRGVLCADRTEGPAFSSSDISVVEDAAAYILRGIENERMFTSIEKTKYELGRFFEASRRLNSVLTPGDVHGVALECIASIVEYDFAAITVFDPEESTHEIVAVDHAGVFASDVDAWVERTFGVNQGLVSMVVKNRHYLPYGGQVREATPVIFTDQERLEDVESMLVLPLIAHDEPIGTMVICHRQPGHFSAERREMLEVVGNQVAISLQNARLYARMEQMATTDGLTGLANHRSFQSKLDETIARHSRTEEPFAVVLTDIDHFKAVNDTHGHPVGDEVLRQVSRVFEDSLREVDTPCRYGGEEFAIILEDADRQTALQIADRVRTGIAALEFQSDKGAFQCTISMGVAIWPHDETEKQPLIDLTDEALYYSKEHGRNQVTSADQL